MRKEKTKKIHLTYELIESFLEEPDRTSHSPGSVKAYRTALRALYESMPHEKLLDTTTAQAWREYLESQGYAPRTIRSRLSMLNSFLHYLGRGEWQFDQPSVQLPVAPEDDIQPELTRPEYLSMLQAARLLEQHRTYLLIKTLGGTGMRIQELPQFTVESVRAGTAPLWYRGTKRMVRIPGSLRQELLDYTTEEGLDSGSVFVTKEGVPLNRAVVWRSINSISGQANIAPQKANPRCLRKMYLTTLGGLPAGMAATQDMVYDSILESEQRSIGWNSPAG